MSLVFAAITPHSPLLIPAIGKDEIKKMEKTKHALEKMEEEIYVTNPQIIFIISPHSGLFEDSFSINAHTDFVSNFEEFGDLSTKREWKGAPDIAAKINHICRQNDIPLQMVSQDKLDHGAAVPLFYITQHLKDCKVLPIGYSKMDATRHIKFGELLKEIIMDENKRVAIIASGDLSHGLKKAISKTENLDEKIKRFLENKEIEELKKLDGSDLLKQADECGYRSILILMGVLKNMNYKFTNYTYEHPFGVGYLTGSFNLG